MSHKLLSTESLVESPFIIVKIGTYTFGNYTGSMSRVRYPNYMKSIQVKKINGAVNTYTINMVYPITENDDPNFFEAVFSSVSNNREIVISYGDWSCPTNIYKSERALITNVKSGVDFAGSKITYTITAVSNSVSLTAATYDFPGRVAKPSDVIKEFLSSQRYNITDIFTGMKNMNSFALADLIDSNDKTVELSPQTSTTLLGYLKYLTSCMSNANDDPNSVLKGSIYLMAIFDDVDNEFGGPYFRIKEVSTANDIQSSTAADTFEVDVGYPGDNFVTSFSVNTDEQWSILYDIGATASQSFYTYKINNNGEMETEWSPSIARNKSSKTIQEQNKTWWTKVTQFPITATLRIKGLVRPAMLMSYVKINAYFYGRKHISSGYYIITGQTDTIDANGYKTELTLVRLREDSASISDIVKNSSGASSIRTSASGASHYHKMGVNAISDKSSVHMSSSDVSHGGHSGIITGADKSSVHIASSGNSFGGHGGNL